MSMGIRLDEKFQDRRKDGIEDAFMRQAVSSAQNRLRDGRLPLRRCRQGRRQGRAAVH